MAEILAERIYDNVIQFKTIQSENIYGRYDPKTTSVGRIVQTLFDNYRCHAGYDSYRSENYTSIYCEDLKRYLCVTDEKTRMCDLIFSKYATMKLNISLEYAYGNEVHPDDDGDDEALAKSLCDSDGLDIYVRTLTGKTVHLSQVPSTVNFFQLKRLIRRSEGIPPTMQRLIFEGTQLMDDKTIGDYNIKTNATLHLILRLRGGMYHETSGRNGNFQPLKKCLFDIESDILPTEDTHTDKQKKTNYANGD
ncbi:MAG: ubiquitin family protein [Harvfovirus sp.]|uniref:Ubiquitin family protein n=1 Tax=Harvfovirus sp. TaxID=2487768 RepID=A0A3G5A003_9VIRU|nr:MAG: ubiquitin family protein [Harvfovirus sp.]